MKLKIFVIVVIFFSLVTGCKSADTVTNDVTEVYFTEFENTYLKITEVVDITEPYQSIEKLNTSEMINKVKNLHETINKIKAELPSNKAALVVEKLEKYISGLEFLQYAARNLDNLPSYDRANIATELTIANMCRRNMQEGTFWRKFDRLS